MRMLTVGVAVLFAVGAFAQEQTPQQRLQQVQQQRQAQDTEGEHAKKDDMPMTKENVLNKLNKINHKELTMGKLAVEKAESPEVKSFGQTLVDDHQKAADTIKEAARVQNVTLAKIEDYDKKAADKTDANLPEAERAAADRSASGVAGSATKDKAKTHAAEMERIKGLSGEAFDVAFVDMMAKGHQDTIAYLDRVKADTNLKELHPLADTLRPGFEKHASTARTLCEKHDHAKPESQSTEPAPGEQQPKRPQVGS